MEEKLKIGKTAFIVFSLISSYLLFVFGLDNLLYPDLRWLGYFELLVSFCIFFNALLFWKTGNYSLHSSFYLISLMVIFLLLFLYGGVENTGIFWIFLFPFIVSFLKSPNESLWWNLLYIFLIFLVVILNLLGFLSLPYSGETLLVGMLVFIVVVVLDYLHIKLTLKLYSKIERLAVRDPLTGLYNRAFIFPYLTKELEKVKRKELDRVCVAYIDLDNFKQINDTMGHFVGDKVLKELATFLVNYFRKEDVIARIGGDEFLIVFPNCKPEEIEKRLQELRKEVEKRLSKYGISLSFGLARAPEDGLLPSSLLNIADRRMYEDKRKRKKEGKSLKSRPTLQRHLPDCN
ncbi:GGDEF domain-containing protein [Thermovibrio sp.]